MERGKRARRARTKVDYAALAGQASDQEEGMAVDFRALSRVLLDRTAYQSAPCQQLPASQLTEAWIADTGLRAPVIVRRAPDAAQTLGLCLPEGKPLSAQRLVDLLGAETEVYTADVSTQSEGPRWTLYQWQLYWRARQLRAKPETTGQLASGAGNGSKQQSKAEDAELEDEAVSAPAGLLDRPRPAVVSVEPASKGPGSRKRFPAPKGISSESKRRILNLAPISLAGTPLQDAVKPPAAVRAVDLVTQVWPEDSTDRPNVQAYAMMTPAGGYADFRIDFGGSSVWYHVITGKKVFAMVPPTPSNLASYAAWMSSAKHLGVFLASLTEGVVYVEASAGDTLLIPGGWAYADASPKETVLAGGNFLHRYALPLQLEMVRLEHFLHTKPHFQFPMLPQTMWHTAAQYVGTLRSASGLSPAELDTRVAAVLAKRPAPPMAAPASPQQQADNLNQLSAHSREDPTDSNAADDDDDSTRAVSRSQSPAKANKGSGRGPLRWRASTQWLPEDDLDGLEDLSDVSISDTDLDESDSGFGRSGRRKPRGARAARAAPVARASRVIRKPARLQSSDEEEDTNEAPAAGLRVSARTAARAARVPARFQQSYEEDDSDGAGAGSSVRVSGRVAARAGAGHAAQVKGASPGAAPARQDDSGARLGSLQQIRQARERRQTRESQQQPQRPESGMGGLAATPKLRFKVGEKRKADQEAMANDHPPNPFEATASAANFYQPDAVSPNQAVQADQRSAPARSPSIKIKGVPGAAASGPPGLVNAGSVGLRQAQPVWLHAGAAATATHGAANGANPAMAGHPPGSLPGASSGLQMHKSGSLKVRLGGSQPPKPTEPILPDANSRLPAPAAGMLSAPSGGLKVRLGGQPTEGDKIPSAGPGLKVKLGASDASAALAQLLKEDPVQAKRSAAPQPRLLVRLGSNAAPTQAASQPNLAIPQVDGAADEEDEPEEGGVEARDVGQFPAAAQPMSVDSGQDASPAVASPAAAVHAAVLAVQQTSQQGGTAEADAHAAETVAPELESVHGEADAGGQLAEKDTPSALVFARPAAQEGAAQQQLPAAEAEAPAAAGPASERSSTGEATTPSAAETASARGPRAGPAAGSSPVQMGVAGGDQPAEAPGQLRSVQSTRPMQPVRLTRWEREGLPLLLQALLSWQQKPGGLGAVPSTIPDPQRLLAELEVLLEEQGISLESTFTPADFTAVPAKALRALQQQPQRPRQAAAREASFVAQSDSEGDTALLEEAGDSMADREMEREVAGWQDEERRTGTKRKAGYTATSTFGRPGVGDRKQPAAKKLSIKDRLKKKLRLK